MMSFSPSAAVGGGGGAGGGGAVNSLRRIAVCQMRSGNDLRANVESASRLVWEARSKGAVMAFLPENFAFLGRSFHESLAIASPLEANGGGLIAPYQKLAKETGLWLNLGGFQELASTTDDGGRDEAERRVFNCSVVIDSSGQVAAAYRKVHLFDSPYAKLRESTFTLPGSTPVVVDSPLGKLGLSICYDLRFGGLYSKLRDMGARVLLVPSAFTLPTGKAHWEVLLRARAIENQCYCIAAAQWGRHNEKRESWGHSMVIDPWGKVIAEHPEGVGVAIADIDLNYVEEVRERIPVGMHARPDVYSKI